MADWEGIQRKLKRFDLRSAVFLFFIFPIPPASFIFKPIDRSDRSPKSPGMRYRDKQLVMSFLERHGFEDVFSPRRLESCCIQMSPVLPIEVAIELDNAAMVKLLRDAGANPPGLATKSWRWICRCVPKKNAERPRKSCLRVKSVYEDGIVSVTF